MSSHNAVHAKRLGSGPTLVLAHGFAQNSACWGSIDSELAKRHSVVAVDLPGHGSSPSASDLWDAANRLVSAGGKGTYLGYSFGARVVLHALLAHPTRVERAVLVSGTPGLKTSEERSQRRSADDALATTIERDGLEVFLDRWLEMPMFASLSEAQAQRPQRLRNTADGLATSLRTCGTGSQDNLWGRLAEITMPVLLISGATDQKFTDIATRFEAIAGPNVEHAIISGAGHSAHLEQPELVTRCVADWLKTTTAEA